MMSGHHKSPLLAFFFVMAIGLAAAQTFQYSRGWTNGRKRSDATVGVQRVAGELAQTLPFSRLLINNAFQHPHSLKNTPKQNMEERLQSVETGLNTLFITNGNGASPAGMPSAGENEYFPEK